MTKLWDILDGNVPPPLSEPLPTAGTPNYEIIRDTGTVVRCVYDDAGHAVSALIVVPYLGRANVNFLTDGTVGMSGMLIPPVHRHFTALVSNSAAYAAALGVTGFRAVYMPTKSAFLVKRYPEWKVTGDVRGRPVLEWEADV